MNQITCLTQMPDNIDQLYDRIKGQLFFQKGSAFLGRLLCDVEFEWTLDVETAAISPKKLYWNPNDFLFNCNEATRISTLAHELLHNALMHPIRIGDRCPKIWNIAADHVINLWLLEHGFILDPQWFIWDERFIGMSTEEVYDILIKEGGADKQPQRLAGDVIPSESPEDVHKCVASAVAAASAAKLAGQPGTIPGETPRVIEEFLYPKLPWNKLLANFFNELVEEEFSYQRPRRRYDDPYLPGRTGRNGLSHLIYGIDISGSTFAEPRIIQRFFSEIKHIHEDLRPEKITIVTFDTVVQDVFELERDDEFSTFEINGGGGTDLHDLFELATKKEATALVVFTDLYVDIPPKPNFPVIWICFQNDHAEVPYGNLVKFSEKKLITV